MFFPTFWTKFDKIQCIWKWLTKNLLEFATLKDWVLKQNCFKQCHCIELSNRKELKNKSESRIRLNLSFPSNATSILGLFNMPGRSDGLIETITKSLKLIRDGNMYGNMVCFWTLRSTAPRRGESRFKFPQNHWNFL